LDLYCGAGGATRGYQEAGFFVVGVDNKLSRITLAMILFWVTFLT